MRNRSEIRETIAGKTLPVAERCHLRIGDLRSRDSVEILVLSPAECQLRGEARTTTKSEMLGYKRRAGVPRQEKARGV